MGLRCICASTAAPRGEQCLVFLWRAYASLLGLSSCALAAALSRDARAQGWEPHPGEAPPGEPDARSAVQVDGEVPPPPSGPKTVFVELAGEAAYVTAPIRGGTNPFGAGFGVRAGLDFSGFYVGVSVLDFLGGKDVDVGYRSLLYGFELGYGWRIPTASSTFLLLRPRFGVGDAAVYYTDPSLAADVVTSASGRSSSSSDTLTVHNVFVQPGVTLELSAGAWVLALDGSSLVLPGIAYGGADPTTWISYGAQLQAGFRF
jgi:hypothetical protein